MKLLVITPIDLEMEALSAAFDKRGLERRDRSIGRLSALSYGDGAITLAQGGLGKAQFGVQTQHLIDHAGSVDLVVCAGTAGRLYNILTVGDVVAATATIEHDFNTAISKKPLPRFEGHPLVLSALQQTAETFRDSFQLHFGPIASGDEGITDPTRAAELREATGAFAVAWEGAGGARAAEFSGIPYLELRGISDGADDDAPIDFYENIPLAMRNVATVITSLAHTAL